ncbi:MAG: hypothetical protein GF355_07120, partial [Candidatus Eisenbacteria bacterium]|nr:hypothetical protein [Candidatus Eisenbacteria bacterium]
TSLGRAHVGYLGHPGAVRDAKLEIIEGLAPDGTLVLPQEPPDLYAAARRLWRGEIVRFGAGAEADVALEEPPQFFPDGTRLRIRGLEEPLAVRILGRGAVSSVLAALAVCRALRLPWPPAAHGMAQVPPPPGRLEPVRAGGVTILLDTYNASPESSLANIELLLQLEGARKRYLAFGEMGELGGYSRTCHEEVGRAAARADGAFFLGEETKWARGEVERLGGASRRYTDHAALARDLARTVAHGDLVLIKGSRRSGMEQVFDLLRARLEEGPPVESQDDGPRGAS